MTTDTDSDFIREVRENTGEPVTSLKEALEACYMNGFYDDMSGEAQSPTGHFYRIERWIVVTDNYGFSEVLSYYNDAKAKEAFELMENDYLYWLGDEA